jgi:uncharacterized protein YqgC (DUF456 family)
MIPALAGILLIIVGVLLWLTVISTGHALAIFLVVFGLGLVLYYAFPTGYARRVR